MQEIALVNDSLSSRIKRIRNAESVLAVIRCNDAPESAYKPLIASDFLLKFVKNPDVQFDRFLSLYI